MPEFDLRYGSFAGPLLGLLGLGRSRSRVTVDGGTIRVRMGWAFNGQAPLQSVRSAAPGQTVALTRGVHGWGGTWLVNGAGDGIVELRLDSPMPARMLGLSLRVRLLRVSVADPGALLEALQA